MKGVSLCALRSALKGRSAESWGPVSFLERKQQQLLSCRSFAADADGADSGVTDDDGQTKKTELGRWWQAFSEQNRRQQGADSTQKTANDDEGRQWFIPNKKEPALVQEQSESGKDAGSRWFLASKEESSTDEERQEITSKQVGARWLASSGERSTTQAEPTDLSSIPWFGSNGESPASERERLEVSLQRLALMSKLGDNNQSSSFMFLPPKDNLLRKYFHWDNLSAAEKHKIELSKVRREFRVHPTDCGSSEVQIALLTNKIKYMTKHMETHRKDYHSRKGLEAMVSQRKRLLKYLRRKDWDSYCEVILKLGLRDNVMDTPSKR